MIFAPEQANDLLHSTVADMTNDPVDGEEYMYSATSGYFVYAQVEDLPDVSRPLYAVCSVSKPWIQALWWYATHRWLPKKVLQFLLSLSIWDFHL